MQNTWLEQSLSFEMLRFTFQFYFRNLSSTMSHTLGLLTEATGDVLSTMVHQNVWFWGSVP